MGWFDDNNDAYNQVQNDQPDHEGKFSHELIAGGASFMAMKVFEDQQRKEGKVVNHQFAKELLAGIAGGEVDKLCETKGADYVDRERAKHEAKQRAERMYDEHYGGDDQYDPNQREPHGQLGDYNGYSDNNSRW
ncbi:hypothetical protein BAUCODRAFT_36602 [Baudoinia panamericana UAMH 10762]|uniref:CipC-like antibiotic response protein n=1 Tax=Baudoinia panamericana (strain UAMH 10762) TaxID=717646 RepID=M2MRM9_BAUPA|nr:uncharacterized protein BAUCODRAFT_36602 [Baudoinia panamericana UAMH 10762]EMC94133.1 hypothetical protein BAUCODRAFT_36602 [Baudoinia panamericana UAMH 10762]